jgi:hypothetical protein
MAEATLVGTGGTALGFGGHGAYGDTKKLRALQLRNIAGKNSVTLGDIPQGKHAIAVTRRNAGLLAGGALALGGAASLRRWAEGNRGRAHD